MSCSMGCANLIDNLYLRDFMVLVIASICCYLKILLTCNMMRPRSLSELTVPSLGRDRGVAAN
jgi:hypothetical protein